MKLNSMTKMVGLMVLVTVILSFSFQNCSRVPLTAVEPPSIFETASLSGEFCSATSLSDDVALNMIFLVDMSKSNIGINVNNVFRGDLASDPEGQRFELIKNFIQSSCLSNKIKARFAVVGFSSGLLPSATICVKERFVSSAQVKNQVNELVTIQAEEPRTPGSRNMISTSYDTGLGCVSQLINSDLASLSDTERKKNYYHVMFLSDGVPTGTNGENLSDFSTIYARINDLKSKAINSGGFILQAIMYGLEKLSDADKAKANEVMNGIAIQGDSLVPSMINNVSNLDFCSLFNSGKRIPYTVTSFGAINMTAHILNGKLKIDSDMDGIPDDEEKIRGFDPTTPRSGVNGNYMLDGFCRTNANLCQARPIATCEVTNEFNISQCELPEMSLTDGVDTDKDGIPDIVEFLKGTNPSKYDSNLDTDGDGEINFKEILKGRDPNFYDNDIDPLLLVEMRRVRSHQPTSECPDTQERWTFSSVNLPLVQTLATRPTDAASLKLPYLTHEAGENIILLYYVLQKSNMTADDSQEIYGEFIKISANKSVVIKKFRKLGVINGTFSPK